MRYDISVATGRTSTLFSGAREAPLRSGGAVAGSDLGFQRFSV